MTEAFPSPSVLGVGRMADDDKAILASFDRPLSDDELRSLHEFLTRWRADYPAAIRPETWEELRLSSNMIRTWMAECFPKNELGQMHFIRAVIESVADVIERALQEHRRDAPFESAE